MARANELFDGEVMGGWAGCFVVPTEGNPSTWAGVRPLQTKGARQ